MKDSLRRRLLVSFPYLSKKSFIKIGRCLLEAFVIDNNSYQIAIVCSLDLLSKLYTMDRDDDDDIRTPSTSPSHSIDEDEINLSPSVLQINQSEALPRGLCACKLIYLINYFLQKMLTNKKMQ
jgi:hypothetical protein